MKLKRGWVQPISLEKPNIQNNTADAQRLEKSLKQSIQNILIEEAESIKVRIPFHIIRHLPTLLRTWDFRAKAVLFREKQDWLLLDILPPDSEKAVLGAAVDIGTTRMEIALIDLQTGLEIANTGFDNPQVAIGPDILTRIHYSAQPGGLEQLSRLLTEALNQSLDHLCRSHGYKKEDIYIVSGAGNTAMTHLFAGIETFDLIKEPYIPCTNIPDTILAREIRLDINENGLVYLFPNIGSYFGGDLIAGIIYSNLDQKQAPCLMVDVGTNAEIVVGCKDFLIACAGAAGPALEGGVSKIGMTAGPGVIDRVWLEPDTREIGFHTIEDKAPVGICGSGMIDLAAALFLSGRMDIRGKLLEAGCRDRLIQKDGINAFVLADEQHSGTGESIVLSQIDLNSLTSSKAAMYTILEVIVKNTAGLEFHNLEKFLVAGTFGSFINPVSAISIGMLPDIPTSLFEVLGNSSLGGAKQLLTSPEAYDRILSIRNSITYIELNVNQEFMNLFSGAKFYPHTDASRFPTVGCDF
jgi:uncharacterized 2Fe-2S/4Fe-4S cluster protein (DUF4445 family)